MGSGISAARSISLHSSDESIRSRAADQGSQRVDEVTWQSHRETSIYRSPAGSCRANRAEAIARHAASHARAINVN
jgi:hypothetical protein